MIKIIAINPDQTEVEQPVSLFSWMVLQALNIIAAPNISGRAYLRLSEQLQLCAYMYETGAILGQTNNVMKARLTLKNPDQVQKTAEASTSLIRRLETPGKNANSLYTFYLCYSMRNMIMDFSIKSMKEAHKVFRTKNEVVNFAESAGIEGFMLGSPFPDLVKKLYRKDHDRRNKTILEMIRHRVIFPEEVALTSIEERERIILEKVKIYFSENKW